MVHSSFSDLASTPPFDRPPFRSRTLDCTGTLFPLGTRTLFNNFTPGYDTDDLFLQSPFKSPSISTYLTTSGDALPSLFVGDDEGSAFSDSFSATTFSRMVFHDGSQSPQTPAMQLRRFPSRLVLSVKSVNVTPHQSDGNDATLSPGRLGVGTKGKSNAFANNCSTPLRQLALTPLRQRALTLLSISASVDATISGGVAFDRFAPLPAPRFSTCTPHSKAETAISPSGEWGDKYGDLGLGKPSAVASAAAKDHIRADRSRVPRTGWLMQRSSIGAFSLGSGESLAGTSTRSRDKGEIILTVGGISLILRCRLASTCCRPTFPFYKQVEIVIITVKLGFLERIAHHSRFAMSKDSTDTRYPLDGWMFA